MVELRERKTEIGVGLFLLVGIGAWLMIPSVFPADTIILVDPSTGGGPVSCLPSGALILAQNLTDLCDVTIVSPLTNELLSYNGTQWVNANFASFNSTAVCSNIGTGVAYVCVEGTQNPIDFRSILNGTGISVANNTSTVTITNTLPEATTASNLGAVSTLSEGVFASEVGNDLRFKKLLEGTGIALSSNSTHITIANTAPESTTCTNVGTGNQLCSGGNVNIDTLIAGTGITITDTTDDWTFASQCANTGTGEAVCESSNNINSLIAGSGISVTDTTGDLTIASTSTLIKLCEVTAAGGETSLACTLSTTPQYFHFNAVFSSSSTDTWVLRFNGDGGNNYAQRSSTNGAADATVTSISSLASVTVATNQIYHQFFHCDNAASGIEKFCEGLRTTTANGAANAPNRVEFVSKWADTASDITTVDLVRTAGTGTLNAGSYIIVYGVS